MQVEIWSDIVCPWCYLGRHNFEQARQVVPFGDDIEVLYRSFELDPAAPRGVTAPTVDHLAEKYGMTRERAEQAQREMEQRAAAAGLTFRMGALETGNTRDAHRLTHLAREHGRQAELVDALHRAYFTDQRSIFTAESLVDIAAEAGLAGDDVRRTLGTDAYEQDVVEDEAVARSLGIDGVPFFVIDRRYGVSGAQPATVLADVLVRAREELPA